MFGLGVVAVGAAVLSLTTNTLTIHLPNGKKKKLVMFQWANIKDLEKHVQKLKEIGDRAFTMRFYNTLLTDLDSETKLSSLGIKHKSKIFIDFIDKSSGIKIEKIENKEIKETIENYKLHYRITKRPIIINRIQSKENKKFKDDEEETKEDKTNKNDEKIVYTTVGIDEKVENFDSDKFISKYCKLYKIKKSQVKINSIKEGSVIIDLHITKENKHSSIFDHMSEITSNDRTIEKLAQLKVFCVMLDPPTVKSGLEGIVNFRNKLVFNSQYDRIYKMEDVYWTGALNDGKNRGGKPYYCPIGWQKRAITYKYFTSQEFDKKFNGWYLGYHGTTFEFGLSMLLSGMAPSGGGNFGRGVYLTPSIIYAAHPRYSEIKIIPEQYREHFCRQRTAKYIQFVFQCRVKAKAVKKVGPQTITRNSMPCQIDPNFNNSELEWVTCTGIDNKFNDPTHDDCKIFITGIMLRITDKHPYLLKDSTWWKHGNYNHKYAEAIDRDLENLKNSGVQASIID